MRSVPRGETEIDQRRGADVGNRRLAGPAGGDIGRIAPRPCMLPIAPPALTNAAAAPDVTRFGFRGDKPLATRFTTPPSIGSVRLSALCVFRRGRPGRACAPPVVAPPPEDTDGELKCMLFATWSTDCTCRRARSWRNWTARKSDVSFDLRVTTYATAAAPTGLCPSLSSGRLRSDAHILVV